MKRFSSLIVALDRTTKTNEKVSALVDYLHAAPEDDKLWALYFLSGKRPRRQVSTSLMRVWASEILRLPLWIVEESYHVVGDLAEALALLLPDPGVEGERSLSEWMEILGGLEGADDSRKREIVVGAWDELSFAGRFVFNKLITGEFRVGVSRNLVIRALAEVLGLDVSAAAHRLMGNWTPRSTSFGALFVDADGPEDPSRPYPFFLASPVEGEVSALGPPEEWQAEWKWDGIRSQLINRGGDFFVWSRGEDLVTDKFPELKALSAVLPDGCVIDGELLCANGDEILPFSVLQTRIGRKNVTAKILRDAPVKVVAYDLMELGREDVRAKPLSERRKLLEEIIVGAGRPDLLAPSRVLGWGSWEELAGIRSGSKAERAEGVMLKRLSSAYQAGRRRGDWWKWKIDPYSVDGVMIYAQRGHGRRANLFTDYTLAVWNGGELVPVAKAYSGLTDEEIYEVDAFVKRNTIDKFGPVRTVKPELVFEVGFEGIQPSARHKSGVALRFPRILRWRKDKKVEDADTLETLRALL